MVLKVGITGQAGFVGTHLFNFLGLKKEEIELIPFADEFYDSQEILNDFVGKCDTIVHLAGMNRHGEPEVIYQTNIRLTTQLIEALLATNNKPHIIFSSSTQEERDNPYGKSKKEARLMLESWAEKNNAVFTGLVIPNVFGPFGRPFYNSFISTFSYQLSHEETPKIDVDASIRFIYVIDLVNKIYELIRKPVSASPFLVDHTAERTVSGILALLISYKENYFDQGLIPVLKDDFEVALFNTFRSYFEMSHYPVSLKKNTDNRGFLIEVVKANTPGQMFYSSTVPGITRGNHFHTRKVERFCVLAGRASIKLRKIGTEEVFEFLVSGDKPEFIDMPVWFTHNITNIGDSDLLTLFWCNEIFNPDDPDTWFQPV